MKPVGKPTVAEKQAVFNRVWKLFDEYYPSFAFKVMNWKQAKAICEPNALTAAQCFCANFHLESTIRTEAWRYRGAQGLEQEASLRVHAILHTPLMSQMDKDRDGMTVKDFLFTYQMRRKTPCFNCL
ncbi:hypothetical protein [Alicyclobacillus sp. ALC3]|uniref:hypothetical protein n=1 Tax=Alicyclobacillus sp. ALC3 TaxID=2796143 RepID=UPI002379AF31|nr:hypothetical protein [Alicyclobacillus sp. ALC3]WDL98569.1 hypothetical protein JC200_07825 [Alicyclobacillus sp. ALC3]